MKKFIFLASVIAFSVTVFSCDILQSGERTTQFSLSRRQTIKQTFGKQKFNTDLAMLSDESSAFCRAFFVCRFSHSLF